MDVREPETAGDLDVLPLHQIQTVHSSNEYMESPTSWSHPKTPEPTPEAVPAGADQSRRVAETRPKPSREQRIMGKANMDVVCVQPKKWTSEQDVMKQGLMGNVDETGTQHSRSCEHIRYIYSEQRIMGSILETDQAIHDQPKGCTSKQEMTLLLETKKVSGKHPWPCDRCGRCRCKKCMSAEPRPLPSCWLCGRRCLCSAETLVDNVTCVCCLKAALYHCASDDEDSSADAPFSCREQRRCTRWSAAVALTLVLPCLLCYPPALGCLALCQFCCSRADHTRCRCKRVKL